MKVKDGLSEVVLKEEQLDEMESLARSQNLRDYFLLALMGRRGLRVGTVVGNKNTVRYTRKKTGETVICKVYLPGIRKEDIGADGIWVHEKGHIQRTVSVPKPLHSELRQYAAKLRKGDRLIPITVQQATNLCKKYARLANIPKWQRIHPHIFRHFFGTYMARKLGRDPWKLKSLMGHKDLRMTMVYVENLSLDEERDIIQNFAWETPA